MWASMWLQVQQPLNYEALLCVLSKQIKYLLVLDCCQTKQIISECHCRLLVVAMEVLRCFFSVF